ncbi:hypothetical protein GEMRC1_001867 [Eukaryota sp. GEM-RC1]
MTDFAPLEDYAIIGDTYSCAIINQNTCSIDFMCLPYFDSPSVFCSLLDSKIGGHWQISPLSQSFKTKSIYHFNTNVLLTRVVVDGGLAEISDWAAISADSNHQSKFFRFIRVYTGQVTFQSEMKPRFNYAQDPHSTEKQGKYKVICRSSTLDLALFSTHPLVVDDDTSSIKSVFTLTDGDCAGFLLTTDTSRDQSQSSPSLSFSEIQTSLQFTINFWQSWISKAKYNGKYREAVLRSALLLKLLIFSPTGAAIASPTFGLPECVGEDRNFDYRYCWLRDSAFVLYALLRLGFTEEANHFIVYLERIIDEAEDCDGCLKLVPVYDIWGKEIPEEQELSHLEGYRRSKPVRIGNEAKHQYQLDIYGEILDCIYLANKWSAPIGYDTWVKVKKLSRYVINNWKNPDNGIWEPRGSQEKSAVQHYTSSKMMSWVALDRCIRMAEKRGLPLDFQLYKSVRTDIYEDVMNNGYNHQLKIFTSSYGSSTLDASVLLAPLTFFVSAQDSRLISTIEAILKPPREGGLFVDGLVYRYNQKQFHDGFAPCEGTFFLCSFWLVECLARRSVTDKASLATAQLILEKLLSFSNSVGLYSEEMCSDGFVGNLCQALTHLALISACFNIDRYTS